MNSIKSLTLLFTFLIILIISGCSTSKVDDAVKIDEFINAPTWVNTKQLEGKISELGSSSKNELTFVEQRDFALNNAKESLSNKLQVKIINIFKLLKDPNVDEAVYEKKVSDETNTMLSNALRDSKIMKLWQSDTKTIYVLVSTDIQKIKEYFKIALKTTFKDMDAISSNYILELEKGNIDIQLSN